MICRRCEKSKLVDDFYKDHRVCKECKKLDRVQHYKKNKNQTRISQNIYKLSHENEIKEYKRIWQNNKINNSLEHKLKNNLRSRLYKVLKRNQKSGSAINDLGCSVEFLKEYLEKQFIEGMSWNNYGKLPGQWSIDHIIALSNVDLTNREQFLKVCHYTNLRPMCQCGVHGNISKGNRL